MSEPRPHLKTLEEIERTALPGLLEVLRTEGIKGVRYALRDTTGWHRDYAPCIWRSRATDQQKRVGWEMWVRMEKIIAAVLHEAHERQVAEATDADKLTEEDRPRLQSEAPPRLPPDGEIPPGERGRLSCPGVVPSWPVGFWLSLRTSSAPCRCGRRRRFERPYSFADWRSA